MATCVLIDQMQIPAERRCTLILDLCSAPASNGGAPPSERWFPDLPPAPRSPADLGDELIVVGQVCPAVDAAVGAVAGGQVGLERLHHAGGWLPAVS